MSVLSRLAKYIFPLVITGLAIAALVLLALVFKKSHTHPPRATAAVKTKRPMMKGCSHGIAKPSLPQRRPQRQLPQRRPQRQPLLRPQMGGGQPAPYVAAGSAGAAPLR